MAALGIDIEKDLCSIKWFSWWFLTMPITTAWIVFMVFKLDDLAKSHAFNHRTLLLQSVEHFRRLPSAGCRVAIINKG